MANTAERPWQYGRYIPLALRPALEAIAEDHWCTFAAVTGQGQSPQCVSARREIAHFLRSKGFSFPEVGRMLGGRHHTTIMSLLRRTGRRAVRKGPAIAKVSRKVTCPDLSGEWAI